MNRKFIISLGLVAALSATVISAYADTTIYTDGIGRMHFLGKDAKNNTSSGYNYSNSAEQDLTRKLYERAESGVVNDTTFDQHPLKNYENTFPDSRFGTTKYWKTKYSNEPVEKDSTVNVNVTKRNYDDVSDKQSLGEINVVKETKKKHWWNKK